MKDYIPHLHYGHCIRKDLKENEPCYGIVDLVFDSYVDEHDDYTDYIFPACEGHFHAVTWYNDEYMKEE